MLKTTTLALALGATLALFACGDDEATCTAVCSGEQIQLCNEDGTLADATACPEGQMCDPGHEGMDYAHCMAEDHGSGDDHSDDHSDDAEETDEHAGHDHD